MVVFTCQNCGESVNKPKVDKHYLTKCRNKTPMLTCIDCLKDFNGDDYNTHTQCMTEAQRYSAKGTVFKEPTGSNKQAKYVQLIQSLLNSKDLTVVQRKLLQICSEHDNVPRKLKKFQNFMNNVARSVKHTEVDLNSVFKILEDAWKKEQSKNASVQTPQKSKIATDELSEKDKDGRNLSKESEEIIDNVEFKKSKKKKHKSNAENLSVEEELQIENETAAEDIKENVNGISKKKLKKQKKYEAYLMELENMGDTETKEITEEDCKKKKKKSKIGQNINENISETCETKMDIELEQKNHKKGKKRKLHDDESENKLTEKKQKTEDAEEAGEQTFNWAETIIRVLESRSDKELSLKRLGKKVIDEYQTVKADHRTYEDLLAKFNKKVKKTEGVRVLKDKAKLIE